MESCAENGGAEPVPGRLEEGQDGHAENVGEAVADYGGVEAVTLLAPDDGDGPDVDGGGEGQQRSVHIRVG